VIAHPQGAIEMARTEQAAGSNPQAEELAGAIAATQQAEVEQLRKILDRRCPVGPSVRGPRSGEALRHCMYTWWGYMLGRAEMRMICLEGGNVRIYASR
jgi:hypothetical protein